MNSNYNKEGLVNFDSNRCADSKFRSHGNWNFIDHWSNNANNMSSVCDGNVADQKFSMTVVQDNSVLLKVKNSRTGKDNCIITRWDARNGLLQGPDETCNANEESHRWTYNLTSKKLQNEYTKECLAVTNDNGPRLKMLPCTSEDDAAQAWLGGFDTVAKCKAMGLSHKQCSPTTLTNVEFACDANGLTPCTIAKVIEKKDAFTSCLERDCKEDVCALPSNVGSARCKTYCTSNNSAGCQRASECKALGISDEACTQTQINVRRKCKELSVDDASCSAAKNTEINGECIRLGLKSEIGTSERQCNATSVTSTMNECNALGISQSKCSLNEIREVQSLNLQQQAIEKAVRSSSSPSSSSFSSSPTSVDVAPSPSVDTKKWILVVLAVLGLICCSSSMIASLVALTSGKV